MTRQQLLQSHIDQLEELLQNKAKKPLYMAPVYDRAINWTKEQIATLSEAAYLP